MSHFIKHISQPPDPILVVCECGEVSESATDHEYHERAVSR